MAHFRALELLALTEAHVFTPAAQGCFLIFLLKENLFVYIYLFFSFFSFISVASIFGSRVDRYRMEICTKNGVTVLNCNLKIVYTISY